MTKFNPIEYDSSERRSPFISEIADLFHYRNLLNLYISNNIKTRYKRSILGVIWSLLNPLLNMAVLTIAFSALFKTKLNNYPIYLLAGLIFWNFFSQTTMVAMDRLIWGGAILKRIYIPRTIFSVSEVGTGLFNLFLAMIPLAIIMAILKHPFKPALLFLPVSILIIALFTLGVALFLSTLALFFVDMVEIYRILISTWFYLTPLIYPIDILPKEYIWIMELNPIYNLLELFRSPIYSGLVPDMKIIIASSLSAIISLLLGWWMFARKVDEFAYRI